MLLFARTVSLNIVRRYQKPSLKDLAANIQKNNVSSKYAKALERFEGRIWFNSVLEVQNVRIRKFDRLMGRKARIQREEMQKQIKPLPLVLNQLCDGALSKLENPEDDESEEMVKVQDLPYSRFLKVEKAEEAELKEDRVPKDWLRDYELYDESEDDVESTYGTPDKTIPVSDVPCGGCGALIHCKDSSIPGYIPSELFNGLTFNELKTINCQRCHFLLNYNTAINVTVTPDDYIKTISTIKDKYALAVVLVDLLDFPCSIFNGLSEILGPKRPIFIVGNKVDLIPKDQPDSLNHIKRCLKDEAMKMGFEEKYIKYVSLISATTGYGVEELITQLHNVWKYKGDVYLIGCTNVGKSSLFNALLRSDYCKVDASDLVHRATACPWPGTTLRMLKFPILNPSDFRLFLRTKRLQHDFKLKIAENQLRKLQAQKTKEIKYATLIGHIGRTFEKDKKEHTDPSVSSHDSGFNGEILTLNEKSLKLKLSKWCYDTPGVIQQDQILHLLTTDEIIKTVPKEMMRARAFLLRPNLTLFLAGLGRLDYIEGPERVRVVLFSSLELPVSIVETPDADEFYESFLGSEVMGIPMNTGEERLAKWPNLEAKHDKIVIDGIEKHITACDILLSSAGWIGINLPKDTTGTFKAWTPQQRGIHVRSPSLLPYGMTLRGNRVRRSISYLIGDAFTYRKTKNF